MLSLFADGDFVLDLEGPGEAPVEENPFAELVADEAPVAVAAAPPEPELPHFHEREWIQGQIGAPGTVVVQRLGNGKVSVTAAELQSAIMLMEFQDRGVQAILPQIPDVWVDKDAWTIACSPVSIHAQHDEKDYRNEVYRNKIYFDIKDAVAPDFQSSKLFRFLSSMGFHTVVSPSLSNWIPKAFRKREKLLTPFLLPEVVDTRPLYERLEDGTILHCIKRFGDHFLADSHYIVGDKVAANEETGEEGHIQLHYYVFDATGRGRAYSCSNRWELTEPMEPYFELVQQSEVIYEPSKCVPEVYKREFEANQERIKAAGWELFEHTKFDVAQAAVKPQYFNGKPMRQGKTREAIAFLKLRDRKRSVFITPKNVCSFVARELDALGIKDYRIIESYTDLEGKQPWMEIIPYGWMKYRRDPLSKKNADRFTRVKPCPHCGELLERRIQQDVPDSSGHVQTHWTWTTDCGYLCRNQACHIQNQTAVNEGAAWGPLGAQPTAGRKRRTQKEMHWKGLAVVDRGSSAVTGGHTRTGSGYIDLARKIHASHIVINSKDNRIVNSFDGRRCTKCGYVEESWTPAPARRLRKRYDGGALDEIHQIKSGSSDITLATMGLKLPVITGLTGTLMPNDPSDAYWPLMRMFGNGSDQFPYKRTQASPYGGVTAFNSDYTDTITITNSVTEGEKETSYKKKIPYLKNPIKFWKMMAPKMIRRSYEDPLVIESLEKAGLKVPTAERRLIVVPPDPAQAALLYASMQEFNKAFQEYRAELAAKGTEDKTYLLNTSYVISRMTRMRMGATIPDYINFRLAKHGMPRLYKGAKGGAKAEHVYNICMNKCSKGEKVLILSDFVDMRKVLAEELAIFNPIVFDTSWNKDQRMEAFDSFNGDSDRQVLLAGPRAIGLGTDLAGGPDSLCRTVVSTDLLWRPGEQLQAWARIMKPAKEKYTVEVYVLVLDASIDKHVYNTFYSKLFAAEQALDRKVISTKEKAFDVGTFVEGVLADRERMLAFMEVANNSAESVYMPYVELFSMEERIV